jgi:prephenate dehydrogenase
LIINIAGGTGEMGKTHKPIFESANHEVIISGRHTKISLEEAAKISDLTIISVPIPYTEDMIKRLAPYCNAIMDFTSLKTFPLRAMLRHSHSDCEVGGLHPLYGEVSSIENRTVVYCKTDRSGIRCENIVNTLKNAGAKIKLMDPKDHDRKAAYEQNARLFLIEAYTRLLIESGMKIEEAFELAPPPTKDLLYLSSRQFNQKNDEMYHAMQEYNPFNDEVKNKLLEIFRNPDPKTPQRIRDFFGEQLSYAQERAKRIVEAIQ